MDELLTMLTAVAAADQPFETYAAAKQAVEAELALPSPAATDQEARTRRGIVLCRAERTVAKELTAFKTKATLLLDVEKDVPAAKRLLRKAVAAQEFLKRVTDAKKQLVS